MKLQLISDHFDLFNPVVYLLVTSSGTFTYLSHSTGRRLDNAEVKITTREDKSAPIFAMSGTQKFNHVGMLGPDGIFVKEFCHTKTEVHKVDYLWKIDNYSFHHAKKSILESTEFTADTNHDCRWYLKLYRRENHKSEDVMGLFLHLSSSSSGKSMFMKYRFSILDDKLKENHTVSSHIHEIVPGGTGCGNGQFILKPYLSVPKLFPSDQLTIYCQITFSEVNGLIEISGETNMNSTRLEADRPEECSISKNFGDLFVKQKLTDVTLSVNDQCYPAHKIILAARSPVFAAMFEHNMKENDSNLVDITDIEEKVVEQMLRYIYTDRCENMKDIATGLLAAADKYDLEGLKSKCQEVLIAGLTVENACETLNLAHLHYATELQSKTVDFIAANSIKITKSAEWKKFAPLYPQSLMMEVCEAISRRASLD